MIDTYQDKTNNRDYFINLCYNRCKQVCEATYKVSRHDYVNWEYYFSYDCFDEVENDKESHLYLDFGDCDNPEEVVWYYYDLS